MFDRLCMMNILKTMNMTFGLHAEEKEKKVDKHVKFYLLH